MKPNLIDLDLKLLVKTPKAILVTDETREVWLPKSQVEYYYTDERKKLVRVTMEQSLAEEKGLV